MNMLKPWFLLIQRPLVLFGAVGWMILATFLIGQLVRPGGDPDLFMDAVYLTVTVLSVYTGWIAGSMLLELQQSTFAFLLPGGASRLLPGFLLFGCGAVLAAALLANAASPVPQQGALLCAFGLGAYATGASIRDPHSGFLTGLGLALFGLLIVTSGHQARLAQEQPVLLLLLAVALLSLGLLRLFGHIPVRRRSVDRGRPVLSFSAAKLGQAAQKRSLAYGPKDSSWAAGYLGEETTRWLRAAWHETYGGQRFRALLKSFAASWGLFLILTIEAGEHSDELGFWKSFCWVVHDGLMRSPHPPLTGEHSGAFIMVSIFIVVGGGTLALWRPVSLAQGILYPLSRRQKADVLFAGSFLDMALLVLTVAPVMFLVGHVAGILAGVTPRFDYVPLFFRAMLVTLILMPLAYWGNLKMRAAAGRQDPYSMVGISFGLSVFCVIAMVLVVLSGTMFPSPLTELFVLLVLLLLSRLSYLNGLHRHYQVADHC